MLYQMFQVSAFGVTGSHLFYGSCLHQICFYGRRLHQICFYGRRLHQICFYGRRLHQFVSMEGVCIKLFLWKASASNCFYDRLLQFVLMVGVQMVSMAGLCIKFVSIASPSIKFVLMASICIKSVLLQTCSLKAITNNIYTAMILFCLFVVVIF